MVNQAIYSINELRNAVIRIKVSENEKSNKIKFIVKINT